MVLAWRSAVVKLSEFLNTSQICLELKATDKAGVINELAEYIKEAKGMKNFKVFLKDVFKREDVATTGIGGEVAIPHARTDAVDSFVIAFGRSSQGVDFHALDGKPCKLFFMLGTPKDQVPRYLQILAHLTRLLKDNAFCNELLAAKTPETVAHVFEEAEK
jgi:fructose-specific phosphotransferase system IIA component